MTGGLLVTHLIVHLQGVGHPSAADVTGLTVHCDVDLLVETLYQDRVPLLVVQETPHRHGDVTAAGMELCIILSEREREREREGEK